MAHFASSDDGGAASSPSWGIDGPWRNRQADVALIRSESPCAQTRDSAGPAGGSSVWRPDRARSIGRSAPSCPAPSRVRDARAICASSCARHVRSLIHPRTSMRMCDAAPSIPGAVLSVQSKTGRLARSRQVTMLLLLVYRARTLELVARVTTHSFFFSSFRAGDHTQFFLFLCCGHAHVPPAIIAPSHVRNSK